jgi:DNA-binding NarL/FixJ family response regulator
MNRCRALIVDDRTQTREGLKAQLATAPPVQVVGETADGREAMHVIEEQRPLASTFELVLKQVPASPSLPVLSGKVLSLTSPPDPSAR